MLLCRVGARPLNSRHSGSPTTYKDLKVRWAVFVHLHYLTCEYIRHTQSVCHVTCQPTVTPDWSTKITRPYFLYRSYVIKGLFFVVRMSMRSLLLQQTVCVSTTLSVCVAFREKEDIPGYASSTLSWTRSSWAAWVSKNDEHKDAADRWGFTCILSCDLASCVHAYITWCAMRYAWSFSSSPNGFHILLYIMSQQVMISTKKIMYNLMSNTRTGDVYHTSIVVQQHQLQASPCASRLCDKQNN